MIARRALQLLVPFLALLAASPSPSSSSSSDCPPGCVCKWISGKETTLCTQLGLTGVPSGAAQGSQVRQKRCPRLRASIIHTTKDTLF